MTAKEHQKYVFEEAPVPRAVWTLAIPTVITQLINIIYNYADTWFLGQTGDASMVAALTIAFPVFVIMAAIANLFGIGGASVISRSLGKKDENRARQAFCFCLWGGFAAAVVYAAAVFLLRSRMIWLIGGDESTYTYVYRYMFWTMVIGAIPTVGNVLCGHLVRSIGAARQAGFGMSMGGVLNVILDPIFIFVIMPPDRRVEGAAIATLISNSAALLYFIIYFIRHRDNPVFDTDPRHFSTKNRIVPDVLVIGFPAALQTTLAMVSNMFANSLLKEYGSSAVAGLGIAKKINMIAFNISMGMTQGVLPLIGYSFGAGNRERMQHTIRYTGTVVVVCGAICTLLFKTFTTPLISFFINESQSVSYGTAFLDIIAWAAPCASLCYLIGTVFQACGQKRNSLILGVLRKGVADIPAMYTFKQVIGINGVLYATPFAEITSVFIAVFMYLRFQKKMLEKTT